MIKSPNSQIWLMDQTEITAKGGLCGGEWLGDPCPPGGQVREHCVFEKI